MKYFVLICGINYTVKVLVLQILKLTYDIVAFHYICSHNKLDST